MPHSAAHFSRFFRSSWSAMWSWMVRITLYSRQSSANSRTHEETLSGRSLICTRNKIGPSTVPWGTPERTSRWMAVGETAVHSNVPVRIWGPRGACRRILWRHSKQPTQDGCARDMAATATARLQQSVLKRVRPGTEISTHGNGKSQFVKYFYKCETKTIMTCSKIFLSEAYRLSQSSH